MSEYEPFDAMDSVRRRIAESFGVPEEMLRNRGPNRALALQALEAQRERHRQAARPGAGCGTASGCGSQVPKYLQPVKNRQFPVRRLRPLGSRGRG